MALITLSLKLWTKSNIICKESHQLLQLKVDNFENYYEIIFGDFIETFYIDEKEITKE